MTAENFPHLSTYQLIERINKAEDFGYDDEQVELNARLALDGLAWRWQQTNGREEVVVYRAEES